MTHPIQRAEGIILRAIPFRDYDHILTLFTREVGLIKLIYHGSRSRKRGGGGICMPMTKVEAVYREKRGDLYTCQEMALLESYSLLRKSLNQMNAGCDLLNAVYASQLPGKPAPKLYELLSCFLGRIPQAPSLSALGTSFRLKLLLHDGLAAFPFTCTECSVPLIDRVFIRQGEGWCDVHRPVGCHAWNRMDLDQIYRMAGGRVFRDIVSHDISVELQRQIACFFECCLKI